MVVKRFGQRHFAVKFVGGGYSDRVILPGRDKSRVKVTVFFGCQHQRFEDLTYNVDETVWIVRGRVRLTTNDGIQEIGDGGVYHVPAGEKYSIECLLPVQAVCFFSQAADGTLPANEIDPVT